MDWKVLKKILVAPTTILPAFAGSVALAIGISGGNPAGPVAIAGITGIIIGVGTMIRRWWQRDEIMAEVEHREDRAQKRVRERDLNRLRWMLRKDRDPRSNQYLKRLRRIDEQFRLNLRQDSNLSEKQAEEIVRQADELFESCLDSLERSLELWDASRRMSTEEGRGRALEAREKILTEVHESTEHLERIYDRVVLLTLDDIRTTELSAVRQELDQSLEVARRVDERMRDLRDSLEPQGHLDDRSQRE